MNTLLTSTQRSLVFATTPRLSLCCLAAFAVVAGPVLAAEAAITSKVDVTRPTQHFTGEESRSLSLSASRILKHVDRALDAIAERNNDDVTANLEKGLTLVRLVDGIVQPTVVKTEIKGAGVTYQDEDSVKPAFLPIFREYDQVDVFANINAQKQKRGPLAGKTVSGPEVVYTEIDATTVKLNMPLAKRDLLQAQDALKKGDTKAATAALEDIQATAVVLEFSRKSEPLVRAMDNLRLAESELKHAQPEQAKAALVGAVDALKSYEKVSGGSRSKDVAELHKEVDAMAKDLAANQPETFTQQISSWWNKCLSWF